jgi:hypothetical protein
MDRFRAAVVLNSTAGSTNVEYGKIRSTYAEAKKDLQVLEAKHPGFHGIVLRPGDPMWTDEVFSLTE